MEFFGAIARGRPFSGLYLLIAGCAIFTGSAQAQESLTLKKIKETGVIALGYRDEEMPFSYFDEKRRPVGYSMDLCHRIVDAIKTKLNLPSLQVKLIPVSTATRFPMVANNTVDLECGVTTNTVERQKTVAFTVTTFVAASRLVSKKSSKIAGVSDLKGKAVVSTVGTTSIRYLTELNQSRNLGATILAGRDDAESFQMVETGRAVAFAMDDVLLRSFVASSRNPTDYAISEETLSVEPYGIVLGRNDPDFKKIADEAIIAVFRTGEIDKIYRKWLQSPIPPKGINLQLPMSPALKRAIASPTASGDPADYR